MTLINIPRVPLGNGLTIMRNTDALDHKIIDIGSDVPS